MATDQVRPKATRHEAFVARQLARAEQRIRRFDVARGFLLLLAGTLAWFACAAGLHHAVGLPAWLRVLALVGFAGAAGLLSARVVVRPWRRPLNPLYTALQVERLLPGACNSVANYVDLREQPLPGTLRQALGLRAARDLADAEPEEAISARPLVLAGLGAGLTAFLFLALVLALGFGPFFAVLWPFRTTRLTVEHPEGGDVTVAAGRPLAVLVRIEDIQEDQRRDAPRLLLEQRPDAPAQEVPLQAQEDGLHWSVNVPAGDLHTGLTYRVRAFGSETPRFHVTVRPRPVLADFRATYHYRPYTGRPDSSTTERDLRALCGTEVLIRARADRPIKSAALDLSGPDAAPQTLTARQVPQDAQAFEVRVTLARRGTYRLRFTSEEDEAFVDDAALLVPLPDRPPTVELTEPMAEDVSLAADGLLRVAGKVRDDIGVAGVALRLRTARGVMLPDRPVRPASLALAGGGHVTTVDFLDNVDLAQLRTEAGAAVTPADGPLEGWLEVKDGCDFPSTGDERVPHVVQSRHFRVRLQPPAPVADPQREKAKQKAREEQKRHEREQEEERRSQEQARQEQARAAETGNPENRTGESGPGGQGAALEQKDAATAAQADKLLQLAQGQDSKGGDQGQPGDAKGDSQPGQAKGGPDGAQGNPQSGGHGDAKDQGGESGSKPGEGKDGSGAGAGAGAGKDEGGTPGNEGGEGKGQGQGQPAPQAGQSKPDGGPPESGPGEPGQAKGPADAAAQAGMSRPAPGDSAKEGAENKPAAGQGDGSAGEARGSGEGGGRGTAKAGNPPDQGPMGERGNPGTAKPGPEDKAVRAEARPVTGSAADKSAQAKPERPQADVQVEDVRRQAEDLGDADPRKQAEAYRNLSQAAVNARDPEARQEARDALAREGLPPGIGERGQGPGPAQTGPGTSGGSGKDPATARTGSGAGGQGGGERSQDRNAAGLDRALPSRPRTPQQARAQRATVLQLLSARELLTPEKLRAAGFQDEAAYRRFLADCEELLRRPHPPRGPGREDLPAAQQAGALPGAANTTTGGTGNDLQSADQGQPPPGYRRAPAELYRLLNP